MNRTLPALATLALLAAPGCKREQKAIERATIEEQPELASFVHVADPKTAFQLLEGFHALEGNAWRWTAKNFSVVLRAPAAATQKGATLKLKLNVPEAVASRIGPQTLTADAGGVTLAPQRFEKPGDYEYVRDVPPQAFRRDSLLLNFALDKALPPGDVDQRELGIIVVAVGLDPK
ncbi:MAG: hypothetical protein RMI94_06100 [Bryobacterales bacterium]|nr:hypothetical protein [Bryobacteraceae bacterium]MDW8130101.1 hypothetical protein [Bryobacterales bacterium]